MAFLQLENTTAKNFQFEIEQLGIDVEVDQNAGTLSVIIFEFRDGADFSDTLQGTISASQDFLEGEEGFWRLGAVAGGCTIGKEIRGLECGGRTSNPVPEPSTIILFGTGLAGVIAWRLKKQKA